MRLLVIEAGPRTDEIAGRLEKLAARAVAIAGPGISPIVACGVTDRAGGADAVPGAMPRRAANGAPTAVPQPRRVWAASAWMPQSTAAQWMVRNGRFPPQVVLEIARQMAVALATLESAKIVHGDIDAQGLLLGAEGDAMLLEPGLRGIVRPAEGYAHAELPPEAYEYLAPERVADGGPPTPAADFYACGCLWWSMLCGRAALTGGDSLSKLQAAHSARIVDARRFAPGGAGGADGGPVGLPGGPARAPPRFRPPFVGHPRSAHTSRPPGAGRVSAAVQQRDGPLDSGRWSMCGCHVVRRRSWWLPHVLWPCWRGNPGAGVAKRGQGAAGHGGACAVGRRG